MLAKVKKHLRAVLAELPVPRRLRLGYRERRQRVGEPGQTQHHAPSPPRKATDRRDGAARLLWDARTFKTRECGTWPDRARRDDCGNRTHRVARASVPYRYFLGVRVGPVQPPSLPESRVAVGPTCRAAPCRGPCSVAAALGGNGRDRRQPTSARYRRAAARCAATARHTVYSLVEMAMLSTMHAPGSAGARTLRPRPRRRRARARPHRHHHQRRCQLLSGARRVRCAGPPLSRGVVTLASRAGDGGPARRRPLRWRRWRLRSLWRALRRRIGPKRRGRRRKTT